MLPTLTRLQRLGHLARLGYRPGRMDWVAPGLTERYLERVEQEQLPLVYPPFRSVEEVVGWEFMSRVDPRWVPMVNVNGGPGVAGGTEIDFYHPLKLLALYFDGPPHQIPGARERDLVLRKGVESLGLKVLAFEYQTVRDVRENLPLWYREHVT